MAKKKASKRADKKGSKSAKAKKKVTIKDLKPKKTSELDVKGGGGAYGGVLTRLR